MAALEGIKPNCTVEDLRQALLEFRETYNTQWLTQWHGFRPPAAINQEQLSPAALVAWASTRYPKNRGRNSASIGGWPILVDLPRVWREENMFTYLRDQLSTIEADASKMTFSQVLAQLRGIGLDDFGSLMFEMPSPELPNLSSILPRMASDEVQDQWTGNHGLTLLRQTCNFVRSAAYNYSRLTARPLNNARILDFGCGYGRIARLMYYFTDPGRLIGVDPWARSIELCHEAGLGDDFRISDYLPETLPVGSENFDFVYAFSVFTHLSERATHNALAAIRRHISKTGVLLITVRPVEYWDLPASIHGREDTTELQVAHHRNGFAFSPHNRAAISGDITYGDTSLTPEWLVRNCPQWKVVGLDRSLDDPYQIYVFLEPV